MQQKVIDYSLKYLTKPGDNFGSVMQSLDVIVAGENNSDHVNKKKTCFQSAKKVKIISNSEYIFFRVGTFTFGVQIGSYESILDANISTRTDVRQRESLLLGYHSGSKTI